MANGDLQFRVHFDIEQGVKEAIAEGDKGLKKFQDAIDKRAINIKLKLDTGRTRAVQSELVGFRKQLAELTREWNALSAAERGGAQGAALRERYRVLQREAQGYVSTLNAAVKQEDKLAAAATRSAVATNKLTKEFKKQDGYVSRLIKRLAVYAGFQQISNFLTNVREVTAQFELQRVSLGAIIQNQSRANQLFSEIKQFALKSPVSILDLTKYTKQVAAYRIETDKLFDTTKRLADVSVGLGVDMGRIVLAYGQVKAASYLRAAEIRQFTEAGIPMLELLAEKFTKLNGEMVTTEQVMDMVSKRGVQFSMVEEIFNDMTSAGGMFYNMQEKQGNTLYGMWAKLGDAASVMYEEIGNTESINKGMKGAIQGLTDLMRNWQSAARMIGAVGIAILAMIGRYKVLAVDIAKVDAIQRTYNARMVQANALASANTRLLRAQGVVMGLYANAMRAASTIAAAFGTSLRAIKSALITTGWGALIVGLGYVADKLFFAKSSADKLKESLDKISEETNVEQSKSVRNFEYLANIATDATKGYKERKDALDELQRTYKNILPQEVLESEYLTKLKGNYDSLTNSIREYVAELQRRKAIDTISEEYGSTKLKYERKLTDYFRDEGWSEQEIARFWEQFYKSAADKSKTLEQAVAEAAKKGGHDGFETVMKLLKNQSRLTKDLDKKSYKAIGLTVIGSVDYIDMLRDAVLEEKKLIDQEEANAEAQKTAASKFAEAWKNKEKALANAKLTKSYGDKGEVDRDSYLGQQMISNSKVFGLGEMLKNEFAEANLQWDNGFGNLKKRINASQPELISSLNFDAIIKYVEEQLNNFKETGVKATDDARREQLQNLLTFAQQAQQEYWNLAPKDVIVQTVQNRLQQIVRAAKGTMDDYVQYQMKTGQTLEAYRKDLKGNIDGLKNEVKGYLYALEQVLAGEAIYAGQFGYGMTKEQIEAKVEELRERQKNLEALYKDLPSFDKNEGSDRHTDNRLQTLQEMVQLAEKLNKEYQDWQKKVGSTEALERVRNTYKDTVKYAEKLAKDNRITLPHLEVPTNAKELNEYLKVIQGLMDNKTIKGGKKAAIELGVKMSSNISTEEQQAIEKKIKDLADRISRTKTAKELYEKILSQTGDVELAANVSTAIYGDDGFELQKRLAEQIRGYFQNDIVSIEIPIDIIGKNNAINYKRLGEFAEQMKDKLGEEPYKAIKKIAEEGQKDMAKTWEGYFKDLEKAESYASKRIKLAQTTADKIANIRADMAANPELQGTGAKLISGLIEKEMKEAAQLEWEAFKDTPLYVQMFEDLEQASTSTLEMMKSRLEALSRTWGSALDPTQLKEMQSRMNEITGQLRERNPWKSLKDAYAQYKAATKSVTAEGAIENTGVAAKKFYDASATYGADSIQAKTAEQELKAREKIAAIVRQITLEQGKQVKGQKALTLAQQKAFDQAEIARGHLEIANAELIAAKQKAEDEGKDPATYPGVIAAQERVKAAEEEVNLTQKVSEILDETAKKSKTLKESLVGAAQNVTQFLQIGSDIAAGIATTMEALGADENDVQYFNDIAEAIGDITAGFQGLIDSSLALNVGGIISNAVGIIPNMVKGFAGLFSAGKIRKANKEIERQQELLDRLEYTYGRLEKAAEKAFGGDFINNFKEQQKNLEAQAQAYMRQAEAERSKGKDADEDKIKEYENAYRDTLDAIADMQGKIAEQMAGTDVESAARDFAQAWLEAYATFSNTTGAIKDKFNDMIKNMVVESVMGKVVQQSLQPMFDEMNEMYLRGESTTKVLSYAFRRSSELAEELNRGLLSAAREAEAAGVDLKGLYQTSDNMKGISRTTAGASEESINANTAALTTQNYYASHLPTISENVAAMRMLMEGGTTTNVAATPAGWTDWQQQAMDNYVAIQRNTADMVVECRNIAAICQAQTELLKKVIVPKGVTPSYRIYTKSDI